MLRSIRFLVQCAAVVATSGSLAMNNAFAQSKNDEAVRPAAFAGSWYPGDRAALTQEISGLLEKAAATNVPGRPVALIAPHAGYRFSAPTAAHAYRCLRGQTYKRVIGIAFSHRLASSYQGVNVPPEWTAYQTPLGQAPLDLEACDDLRKRPGFRSDVGIDRSEHSLELQLPFLQSVLKDFKLVPLYVGRMSEGDYARAAEAILRWVDDQTLIVVSSDFTHFGSNYDYVPFKDSEQTKLRALADKAAAPITACDFDGFENHLAKTGDTICGRGPILLLLRILSMQGGADGVRAAIDMSGNLLGNWENSVTYQAFVFARRPGKSSADERRQLLQIARQTIEAHLSGKEPPTIDAAKLPKPLKEKGACFVTMQNHGQLRGCIGNMVAEGPLCESVVRNAVLACKDYRFTSEPVTLKELKDIDLEISYLTPMQRVKDTSEIVIGRHGLLISLRGYRGVLLPQVAYERGWTRQEFLEQTCRKAGLSLDAWRDKDAEIYSFEAEVFGENDHGSPSA